MEIYNFIKSNKYKLLIIIALLVICLFIFWSSRQSYVVFETNSDQEMVLITVDSLNNKKNTVIRSSEKIKLQKGNYTIYLSSDNLSYFTSVDTSGFFETKTIIADLKPSKIENFVANAPGNCGFLNEVYVSFDCNSSTDSFKTHLPGSASSAPYNYSSLNNRGLGTTGNIFSINGRFYTVIQENDQRKTGRNVLYEVSLNGKDLQFKSISRLSEIDSNNIYLGEQYGDGFILYSPSTSGLYYYKDVQNLSDFEYLNELSKPYDNNLVITDLNTSNGGVVVTSSNVSDPNRASDISLIRIKSEDKIFNSELPYQIEKASFCGDNKLCALKDNRLVVYKLSGAELIEEYSYGMINDYFVKEKDKLVLSFEDKIIDFSLEANSGYSSFVHKGYDLKNFINNSQDKTVAVIGSGISTSVVVLSDEDNKLSGNITEIINKLGSSELIDGVSVYNKKVYITPKLGDIEFIPEKGYFDYTDENKNSVNQQINKMLEDLQFNNTGYSIVNLIN